MVLFCGIHYHPKRQDKNGKMYFYANRDPTTLSNYKDIKPIFYLYFFVFI